MRPTPRTTPDEWARHNRVYKPSAGVPGPRDPALTPYMVPFAQAFDVVAQIDRYGISYDAIVMVTSSQSGKTDAVLDVIGSTLDQRPAPIMYVGPTKDFLNREIEPRVMDMLTGAPRLRERLATGKRMTRFRKLVGGVPLALAWAGSASQVAGMAAKYAIIDELDRIDASIQGEGDPFALVEARGFSFRDRIRAAISTPLSGSVDIEHDEASGLEFWKQMQPEDIESPIWRLWQQGTRHHFAWPCPECGVYFIPRFKQLRWPGWPEARSAADAKRGAHLECPHCGGVIEEGAKRAMNARGVYAAPGQSVSPDGEVTGEPPDTTTLSFWVSGLCSPFVTFGERAASYVAAKLADDQAKLQGVINTGFGELYAPGAGDVPEWEEVAALKRAYKRLDLPTGVRLLTLTADVQKRRIIYVIRGWGAKASSWLVDFGELHGPTTESEVWNELAEVLHRPIGDLVIRRGFIDSGFRPGKPEQVPVNRVYEFCRRFPRLVYPTKGRATQDKPLVLSKIEVTPRGDTRKYGLDLILLDTDHFKSWVHERIRWEADKPGAWLLPADATDDYCKQIVSEARVKRPNGAPQWVQRSRENHYLDCEAMQAAVAHMLNAHLIREEAPPERPESLPPRPMTTATVQKVHATAKSEPPPLADALATSIPVASRDAATQRRERIAALGARMASRMR